MVVVRAISNENSPLEQLDKMSVADAGVELNRQTVIGTASLDHKMQFCLRDLTFSSVIDLVFKELRRFGCGLVFTWKTRRHSVKTPTMLTIGLMLVSACTTPADVSKPMSAASDPNAQVKLVETVGGFGVDVSYSRYQFVPEASALITACRSLALSRATDEAKRRGRTIKPVLEQDIRVSAGRNIVTARTKCRAYGEFRWAS